MFFKNVMCILKNKKIVSIFVPRSFKVLLIKKGGGIGPEKPWQPNVNGAKSNPVCDPGQISLS
jgi:hypothetical protein